MKTKLPTKAYEHNVIALGPSGRYWFCPKVEVLPNGVRKVIGKKVDVTVSVDALLKNRKRKAPQR